jgi:hypothetical protein
MSSMKQQLNAGVLVVVVLLASFAFTQDKYEDLGVKDTKVKALNPHPLTALMERVNAKLKPELAGKHPRVFVTDEELQALRVRAHTSHAEIWRGVVSNLRALQGDPPPPPAEARRAQNDVAIAIAEAALAYKIDGDTRYLAAAKKYMDAAVSYDVWGYSFNKPNVDLAAGHLLYGLGWGYDLLYNDLTEAERERYRNKLARQGHLMYEAFKPKPGRMYTYSQNHLFIPMAGLGIAAYAVYGEVPEAAEWAKLARAMYDRVLGTYSEDGYYYEGFEYWIFSTPWIVHYLDAQLHSTGEDLFDIPGLRKTHLYVANEMLPGGDNVFDFGDVFNGPLARTGHDAEETARTHPNGHFNTNYNLLYRLAARFQNPEAQGVAEWMKSLGQVNAEDYWSLLWYDPALKAKPIDLLPRSHEFTDHGVVYWRTGWGKNATAVAFKCGPPEGHSALEALQKYPDWRREEGHAHPDANSFIIFAGGQYLTGDSGYAGVPATDQHNTLLVNGKGQARDGSGHNAWRDVPYERLNQIRIVQAKLAADGFSIIGDATSAYEPELGVKKFVRTFSFSAKQGFAVGDEVETSKPSVFSTLVHADEKIGEMSPKRFSIQRGNVRMVVSVEQPAPASTKIEPNMVTGPGRPGSVSDGERQARGERLVISTQKPETSAKFMLRMQVEKGGSPETASGKKQ